MSCPSKIKNVWEGPCPLLLPYTDKNDGLRADNIVAVVQQLSLRRNLFLKASGVTSSITLGFTIQCILFLYFSFTANLSLFQVCRKICPVWSKLQSLGLNIQRFGCAENQIQGYVIKRNIWSSLGRKQNFCNENRSQNIALEL